MIWTEEHLKRFPHLFPKLRGAIKNGRHLFLQAFRHMTENACRWRTLTGALFVDAFVEIVQTFLAADLQNDAFDGSVVRRFRRIRFQAT